MRSQLSALGAQQWLSLLFCICRSAAHSDDVLEMDANRLPVVICISASLSSEILDPGGGRKVPPRSFRISPAMTHEQQK
jgi:hypothetical protein